MNLCIHIHVNVTIIIKEEEAFNLRVVVTGKGLKEKDLGDAGPKKGSRLRGIIVLKLKCILERQSY